MQARVRCTSAGQGTLYVCRPWYKYAYTANVHFLCAVRRAFLRMPMKVRFFRILANIPFIHAGQGTDLPIQTKVRFPYTVQDEVLRI